MTKQTTQQKTNITTLSKTFYGSVVILLSSSALIDVYAVLDEKRQYTSYIVKVWKEDNHLHDIIKVDGCLTGARLTRLEENLARAKEQPTEEAR